MKKLKVLLMSPPMTVRRGIVPPLVPPIGLAYLAAVLGKAFEVRIIDCLAEGYMGRIEVARGLERVGLNDDEIQMRLANFEPDIVGVSCLSSDQAENAHFACSVAKKYARLSRKEIITVVGGPHATTSPREVMKDPNVDFSIIGEGELPFYEFCEAQQEGKPVLNIQGLAYRDLFDNVQINSRTRYVEDLDQIPHPARDLLFLEKYSYVPPFYGKSKEMPHTSVLFSRGCPASCSFCTVPKIFGPTFRTRSPENVLSELSGLIRERNIREFYFLEDNLFHDVDRAFNLFKAMVDWKLNVEWVAPTGVAVWEADKELISVMKQSGCYAIWIDFGCSNPEIYRQVLAKPGGPDRLKLFASSLRKAGIKVGGTFTVRIPQEVMDDVKQTIETALELNLDYVKFFVFVPYPGTGLWQVSRDRMYFKREITFRDLLNGAEFLELPDNPLSQVKSLLEKAETRLEISMALSDHSRIISNIPSFLLRTIRDPSTPFKSLARILNAFSRR